MKISNALQTSDELLQQLRQLMTQANQDDNRALNMVLRQQIEMAVKINQALNELSEVGL